MYLSLSLGLGTRYLPLRQGSMFLMNTRLEKLLRGSQKVRPVEAV